MATPQQIQAALQRAQAAGDQEAIQDLTMRLQEAQQAPQQATPAQAAPQGSQGGSEYSRAGDYGPFMAGVADAGIRGALGIKQLFGGLSDSDKGVLAAMQDEKDNDPSKFARGTGDVAGNVAATLIPGSKLAGAANGLRLVQATGRAAPLLGAGLVGATSNAVLSPGEGEGYLDQLGGKGIEAAKGFAGGALGQGLVQAASKPITGLFKALPEAVELFKQGVNPTLQQAAASPFGRWIGGLASGVSNVRGRQEQEVADALLGRITEGKVSATGGTGGDYVRAGKQYLSDEYDKVMDGKRFPISTVLRQVANDEATRQNAEKQFSQQAQEAGRIVNNIMGDAPYNMSVSSDRLRRDFLSPLSKSAYAHPEDQVRDRVLEARQAVIDMSRNKALNASERARLGELDSMNYDLQRLREATTGARTEDYGVNLSRLTNAYGAKSGQGAKIGNTTEETLIGPARRVLGAAPKQDESRALAVALRRTAIPTAIAGGGVMAGAPGALAVGIPYGVSLIGQTGRGAKALTGQYESQKALAAALRDPAMQALIGGATTD